jgi:hypothetical protein
MEMLMRVPESDKPLAGWMLEYEFEPLLAEEPVVSRRWVFRRARNIDNPNTAAEKRQLLKRLIAA